MPIDYSKFANIEDSDEEPEKEKTKVTKTAESAAPAKTKCANCGKEGAKMLSCSVCKKVGYCSRDCQKSDWQFHKRVCKKPEPKQDDKEKKAGGGGGTAAASSTKRPKKKAAPAGPDPDDDDDDDEPITWYKHRETKLPPSATGPEKITEPAPAALSAAPASGVEQPPPERRGSAWNSAGTWEERDEMPWVKTKLGALLASGGGLERDFGAGLVRVTGVKDVSGDASVGVIRGTARHMFDLALEVTWEAGIGGVSKPAKGSLKFSDFGDAAALSTDDVQCECVFTDEKRVPAEHRAAVRREVGGGAGDSAGCAAGKTLAGDVLAKLVAEFIPAFNAL